MYSAVVNARKMTAESTRMAMADASMFGEANSPVTV